MKFRRNVKEEKLFRHVAIGGIVLLAVLLIFYLITRVDALLDLMIPALLIPPLFFFASSTAKKQFIEFTENRIVLVNGNGRDITIDISDIEVILMPSSIALKSKAKDNSIFFKRRECQNLVSHSIEIEKYIKENLKITIVYYDDYGKSEAKRA